MVAWQLLTFLKKSHNSTTRVTLVHFDYQNTPASDSSANIAFLESLPALFKDKLIVIPVDCSKWRPELGPEGSARAFKRDFMASAGYDFYFIGHNADDHIETILIQLLRGAGKGSKGIPDKIQGNLIRPILDMDRQAVRDACAFRNLPFFVDSTNLLPTYTRNFFRLEVIPLLKSHYGAGIYKRIRKIGEQWS